MPPPEVLYRYRPLDDVLLERELDALQESYLFAPPFAAMNDPMEAFYETGGPEDQVLNALLSQFGTKVEDFYEMLSEKVRTFALVSFAGSHEDLPMWAYYASNFAGMCLEFGTAALGIGDFQNEKLLPVTYAREAMPPFTAASFAHERAKEAILARITRKRIEWAHEREWRFVTGQSGRKHYLDDALRRVFLGPRIKAAHADRVCAILDRRPVEVMKGEIRGYELVFRSIKPACPPGECERIGAGRADYAENLDAEPQLRDFLAVPFETLLDEYNRTLLSPNMDHVAAIGISSNDKELIYFLTVYKLRSGRQIYHRRHFDRNFQLVTR